jgi:hypothetical protein
MFMGQTKSDESSPRQNFSSAGFFLLKQCHNYKSKRAAVNLYSGCTALKPISQMLLDNPDLLNNNVMKLNSCHGYKIFNKLDSLIFFADKLFQTKKGDANEKRTCFDRGERHS